MTNEQLAALAVTWAQEIATQMQSYAEAQIVAAIGGTDLHDPASHIQSCAEMPFQWWSNLPGTQQQAVLTNMRTLADECLRRLGSTSGPVTEVSHAMIASDQHHVSTAQRLHPLAASRGSDYSATDSPHYAPPVATSSDPDVIISSNKPSATSKGTTSSNQPQGYTTLTQQQHVDIAWSVSHLACSGDPQVCKHIAVLQKALNVPFFIVPVCLPGLTLEWFQDEVKLNRDIIYLEGGTKAVEESRLTGWQSDIGVTFQYSGKEMQPEEGGLSPCVAKVRYNARGIVHTCTLH